MSEKQQKYRIEEALLHKKNLGKHTLTNVIVSKYSATTSGVGPFYHYTSPEGLMGILRNKHIFFTDCQFLNDYQENLGDFKAEINTGIYAKEDFINQGTASEEMLDFLCAVHHYGESLCITGATSSGKTTLMSWILSTLPDNKRLYTIENGTREFNLIKRNEKGEVIKNKSFVGIHAVAVPGMVAGLYEIHQKFGKLPFANVVQPSIELAEKGALVSKHMFDKLVSEKETYRKSNRVF